MRGKYQRERFCMTHIMESYFNDIVDSICKAVRFDSSLKPAEGVYPFGKETADCLNFYLSLASEMGFETHNYDNYVGEVVFGEGEELAVLVHLDVVPAGGGWRFPPFAAVINDELSAGGVPGVKIWGRGTMDDKGPAVAVLYCLKALKDEGFVPKRKIKLIVGCNEENGWACIEHYEKAATMPEVGFSPDGGFPVIYAEKGILHVRLHFPVSDAPFIFFEGGESYNMVCDRCEATPRTLAMARAREFGFEIRNKKLIAHGKSAHASTPELGVNAIEPMLTYFENKSADVKRILDCLFRDKYGLKKLHDETGYLTLSPDLIKYRRGELQVVCDIRYPATLPLSAVTEKLSEMGVKYETLRHQAPLMHEKDGKLVSELLAAYEAYTGRKAEPVAIGGGTYARALKCGVAFGPEMEDDEPVVHQANEYITLARVEMLLAVYADALRRLTK